MLKSGLLFCVVIQLVVSTPISDNLVIKLPDGQIQGTSYITNTNKTYYGFQGIRYAAPPIGNLRFEAPQPPKPWEGIWDATKDGNSCMSVDHWLFKDIITESEDCLYINVYTPKLKSDSKLPVMFFIYGGGFSAGTSSKVFYGPDFLVEQDVIVVTSNYRLASFGFLSTGDTAIRGNAGLKDQNLALKWTHENIVYFGGDSEKITIFGQSAGGASTSFHVLSKKSKGLFSAAIIESGAAVNYWAINLDPKSFAFSLADELSGESYKNDTQKLKEFLQDKSAEEIINATISLTGPDLRNWPVMEVEDEDSFISESPYELLASGRFNQVPIVIGVCSEESLGFLLDLEHAKQFALLYDSNSSLLIPSDLRQNASDSNAVTETMQDIYLQEGDTFSSNLVALANYFTDQIITAAVIKEAELLSNYVPVYLYQFSYYGRPFIKAFFIDGAEQAAHGAEIPFIFKFPSLGYSSDATDMLTQNRMTTLWTNFAKFLNPTPVPSELLNNTLWSTISPTNLQFLNINGTIELRSNLRGNSYPQWNSIYETYGKKPLITF